MLRPPRLDEALAVREDAFRDERPRTESEFLLRDSDLLLELALREFPADDLLARLLLDRELDADRVPRELEDLEELLLRVLLDFEGIVKSPFLIECDENDCATGCQV